MVVIKDQLDVDPEFLLQLSLGEGILRTEPCRQLRDGEVVKTISHVPALGGDVRALFS